MVGSTILNDLELRQDVECAQRGTRSRRIVHLDDREPIPGSGDPAEDGHLTHLRDRHPEEASHA